MALLLIKYTNPSDQAMIFTLKCDHAFKFVTLTSYIA
jgi:hypothetical protein